MTNVPSLRLTSTPPESSSTARCRGLRAVVSTMSLRTLRCLTLLAAVFFGGSAEFAVAQEPSGSASEFIDINTQGLGISVRGGHAAGNTVGRKESVTHFSLSPYVNIGDGLIFGDSRLVYSNSGEVAWSFGSGYRHYVTAWDAFLGAYGYYDWDQLTGANFKQWSAGLELVGQKWEARGNIYRPFDSKSARTGTRIDPNSSVFIGNTVEFSRIDTFAEAFQGFDAEIGFLLPGEVAERFDVRAFGGGYMYEGDGQPRFGGFSTRLQADIADWLELDLKLTDDDVLSTNVSFNAVVHFGGFHSEVHTSRSAIQRMAEPVRRNLNIVSATTDVTVAGLVATDANGNPLNFVHVNSAAGSGGNGTVENPFNQLSTGLGVPNSDVVFVHAGSTFNAAPDNSAVLANGQSVFGEGQIAFGAETRNVVNTIDLVNVGELTLPSSPTFIANPTLGRPTLSGAGGDIITMGNDSRIGGFILDSGSGHGIVIDGVSNTNVRDTLITNVGGSGIFVQNTAAGTSTTILDTIINDATGPAFFVGAGAGNIGFNSTSTNLDPSFGAIINSSQEAVLVENRTGGSVNMFGTTIDDNGGAGIVIRDSAGNVTIDNATINNSTGTGISITNSDGNFSFRDTLRAATTIDSPADDAVEIDGLTANSTVTFENLTITNPGASGIDIDNLAGSFVFTRDLTIGAPVAGATVSPALSVANSAATGVVQFGGDVNILGTTGRGVEIDSNLAGSSFSVNGLLTVSNAVAEAVAITNNGGTVQMNGGTQILGRGAEGIIVNSSSGPVSFQNATGIPNPNGVPDTGVRITNSESLVLFQDLTVTDALGGGGVVLTDNLAGTVGPGRMVFESLIVTSTTGDGLFANNNSEIRIFDGSIVSNLAAAVDIANSGINITFESLDSANSPDFGISLVETNVTGLKTFVVTGDTTVGGFGTGGTISAAATAGLNMQNAGQVSLTSMTFDDNNYGIFVRNRGLTVDDDQFLELSFAQVLESDARGIDSLNLSELTIEDSIFTDNGDSAAVNPDPEGNILLVNRETIFLNYDERLNDEDLTRFTQFNDPYTVDIFRTAFVAETDDTIEIRNDVAAVGAYIDVNVSSNTFIMNDGLDFPGDQDEAAFLFDWNGVGRVFLFNNTITMNGQTTTGTQTAFDITNTSFTDELIVDVTSNAIPVSIQPGAIGLNLSTNALSSSLINNNGFEFSGTDSTGMLFDMGPNTEIALIGNNLQFLNDGGTGIEFTMVEQPASITISNNLIGLTDLAVGTPETGILFRTVVGTPFLQGALNNEIVLLNPGPIGPAGTIPANINIDFQIPRANGQILINGALRP